MALKPLNPGLATPLGQFDGIDTELTGYLGGEVVTFTSVLLSGTDHAASDSFQQLTDQATRRTVVTRNLTDGYRPLMLADEGIAGYGTLFGSVVGGTVGQVSTGGTVLGPHTTSGSGKVTCWHTPGLYAVSLDAVEQIAAPGSTTTGLQPTNTNIHAGAALYATATGLLTPTSANSFDAAHTVIARFVDFEANMSLVNTPPHLVAALNSPSGIVSSVGPRHYDVVVIHFNPPIA